MTTASFPRSALAALVLCSLGATDAPVVSPSAAQDATTIQSHAPPTDRVQIAQRRECAQTAGPFATQGRAMEHRRQNQAKGLRVSNGVFICTDRQGYRAYCYTVFAPC